GTVLVAALLVIVALVVVVTAISMTSMVEKTTTVNHKISNRALYAADSGVEAMKQTMSAYARGKLDSLNAAWPGNGAIISNPSDFFPTGGLTSSNGSDPVYTGNVTFDFRDSVLAGQSQVYDYNYTITSSGSYNASSRSIVSEGRLRVSATRGSFADYLIFTDDHVTPSGHDIWFHTSGYFDGRVHSNGKLRLAGFPTFEDLVTSGIQEAWYNNNNSPVSLDANFNSTIDVPNFYGGFDRAVPTINLPTNSFSQERASLGGNAADTNPMTDTERRSLLGIGGTGPLTNGVYVPNSGGYLSGGIYVAGGAERMRLLVDGTDRQVIQIRDRSGNDTEVTIDYVNGTTTVDPPSASATTYTGTPSGSLYSNGQIDDLRGPDRSGSTVVPALAPEHKMTISSNSDIIIERDLASKDFDGGESILGLFSSGGNVRIGSGAPDDLQIDAFVMASDNNKVFTVDNYDTGSYRGQVHLRGGMITNVYGAFGTFDGNGVTTGYGRDFRYDRRGLIPPYFPLTQRFVTDEPVPVVLAWREQ
ncbi:MAG: DUF4900 domain-containing protein, partial [Candidatus Eisenbacteria bacterium]|nr:DUF4900 domain-containing protein [Candidatus Eisenbacteria bacterium]